MVFASASAESLRAGNYDVIIVGAGAVGITSAVALARAGHRVLLLEGGPRTPPQDWQERNQGRNAGRPHDGLRTGRMQAYGGTTRLWGGQLVPFDREDFAAEPGLGKPGWPMAYDDFWPWVEQAYDLLKVPSRARDTRALWRQATGLDPQFGDDISINMNIWLRQPDFTQLFADDLSALPNLHIVTDAPLLDLRFEGRHKISALHVRLQGQDVEIPASRVILAMGTIAIVRQLLVTARTQPQCGFAENAHLGRWFIDHVHGLCGRIAATNVKQLSAVFDNIYYAGYKFNVKMRAEPRLRQARGIGNAAATVNAPMGIRAMITDLLGLLKRIFRGHAPSFLAAVRQSLSLSFVLFPLAWRYLVQRRSSTLIGSEVWLGLELEQLPSEASYIALDPALPPVEAPVELHWSIGERELRAAQAMATEVARMFAASGYGAIEIDPALARGDLAWLDTCHDSNHHMGGARMAARAEDGVVDADCRVFGTDNLYLAGAAVFPSGSFANPTLSAIALSLRLAAHLDSLIRDGGAA